MFYFHPENWGRWTHFDEHIFSDGLKLPTSTHLKHTCGVKRYQVFGWRRKRSSLQGSNVLKHLKRKANISWSQRYTPFQALDLRRTSWGFQHSIHFFFPKSRTILAPDSDDLDLLHGGEKIGGPQNYTIWKVDGTNPPKGGIVRGYDKPRLMGVEPSTFQVVWVFPKIGVFPPKWMVKIMENPIKMDDLGVPLFSETSV